MTKPIEWTTTRKEDVPQRRHLEVCVCEERDQPRPGGWQKVDQQWATPSDLVAALAAMGEGERAEVLRSCGAFCVATEVVTSKEYEAATARAEKAERERDEAQRNATDLAAVAARHAKERDEARKERDRSNHLRAGMLPDTRRELGALGCEDVADAARRVVAERDEAVNCQAAHRADEYRAWAKVAEAERERELLLQSNARYSAAAAGAIRDRDAAEGERNRAQAEADSLRGKLADSERMTSNERKWIEGARDILGTLPMETLHEAARRVVADRDSLRSRLIAAETAAAQREPREYPLAEGSKWRDGHTVRDDDGVDLSIDQGVLVVHQDGDAATVKIMCYLADVLALAHRRGLL